MFEEVKEEKNFKIWSALTCQSFCFQLRLVDVAFPIGRFEKLG
jgi:hypothetical protein